MKDLFCVSLKFGKAGRARRRFFMGLGCALALAAALHTVWQLPLTGYTQAVEPLCGKEEHVHRDACGVTQVLVCGMQEAGILNCPLEIHRHTDQCRDRGGNLICGYADFVIHHHDSLCYDSAGNLVCTLPEISPHTHSESCYRTETVLLCGYEEGESETSHVHGEDCYTEEQGYVCGYEDGELITVHTHDETCYTTQKELTCTLPEDENHSHDNACNSEKRVLVCGLPSEEAHAHGESCMGSRRVLVCTEPETQPHVHTEDCYAEAVQTLICGKAEIIPHIHSAGCFSRQLVCGLEHDHKEGCYALLPVCGRVEIRQHQHTQDCLLPDLGHTHTDACYETVYDCGLEEHTHTSACFPDENADLETPADWEASLPDGLTGNRAEDLVRIARSQLGYTESTRNVRLDADGTVRGITRYGQWYGDPYGPWNAPFVCFCLHYAGIGEDILPYASESFAWTALLRERGLYVPAEEALESPAAGDLIFLDEDGDGNADRVGIVTKAEDGILTLIQGDLDDSAAETRLPAKDPSIKGFCSLPEQEDTPEITEPVTGEYDLEYETDTLILRIHLSAPASPEEAEPALPDASPEESSISADEGALFSLSRDNEGTEETGENASPEPSGEEPMELSMTVTPLEEASADYLRLEDYVRENLTEDPFTLEALRIRFFAGEQAVDTANWTVTAQISPKTALLDAGLEQVQDENPAQEADLGVAFTVLQVQDTDVTAGEDAVMLAQDSQAPTLTAAVGTDGIVALAAVTANPRFTVQYYAYIDTVNTSGSVGLPIIDTDNGGTCQGGILPTNSSAPRIRQLFLENISGSVFQVATNKGTVTPVYQACDYEYIHAPNLTYFNRLYENGNYTLSEVWVLNSGSSPESTEETDWTVYTDPASLHFTNRSQSAQEDGMVLIENDAVIRLVFDTTTSSYTNAATFYDYDITDGRFYQSASTSGGTYDTQSAAGSNPVYAYTDRQGINSGSNYTGSGAKLAYGNSNAGSGLGDETWNGNSLNKFNTGSYKGCTFGIAAGLDGDGHIQYASGIDAPSLFNESTATGKTAYTGMSLTFQRDGDTYTLSGVNAGAANLNRFTHITSYASGGACDIYTNFFWPMDVVSSFGSPGHDLKFGNFKIREQRQFFGASTGTFPTVDENITNDRDHNCYFGMQYMVKFELTEDYIGPLEYYFFGDDDMWVFLDGRLVCDIGGVHSSVGEYVNLWDWLEKGSDAGSHTLSFYYTERGASGSSCYMRFTLPSVSSVTPEQNTGTLRVEKEVIGPTKEADQDTEFNFRIFFTDAAGNKLKDDYSYTRYDRDGNIVKKDLIIYDGGSFQLRDGEYIIVKYLPLGARYYVSEDDTDYITSVSINAGEAVSSRDASGTITKTKEDKIHYINELEYLLPQTGGAGTRLFSLVGTLLMALPAAAECMRRRRERRVR